MAIEKLFLNGTPGNGRQVKVAATASPGTVIHTAHAEAKDEVWLWLYNNGTAVATVTIEWGGVTADDRKIFEVDPKAAGIIAIPGHTLTNSLLVRAYASAAVYIDGHVNRIT